MTPAALRIDASEPRLRRGNPDPGEVSEGAVAGPSDEERRLRRRSPGLGQASEKAVRAPSE